MKLVDFINQLIVGSPTTTDYSKIIFVHSEYPYLFISLLQRHLKKQFIIESLVSGDGTSMSALTLTGTQTSFLGNSIIYFYNGIYEGESRKKTGILEQLQSYSGSQTVVVVSKSPLTLQTRDIQIELDHPVDKALFKALIVLAGFDFSERLQAAQKIVFSRVGKLSLELACLLLNYVTVAGSWFDDFSKQWLDLIVQPDTSLFVLSQYLFAKNVTGFYGQWQKISHHYSDMFWISFWSEQLFRACHVVQFQQQKHFAQAKAISHRLPFSFLNQDWKKYSAQELSHAHDFVYALDHSLKNGSDQTMLDVFYHGFFNGTFR